MTREETIKVMAGIKTREDAVKVYEERFGGFPEYLLMGASDEYVIWQVRRALRLGREITADERGAAY